MKMPSFSLEGRVALVTGARRGIGKAIALALAGAGADVAVCDIVVEGGELQDVAEEIQGIGRRSLAIQTDVSQKPEVDNLVRQVEEGLGGIDILVNNAGISGAPVLIDTPEDVWDRVIDVNLKGSFLCSQTVARGMVERGGGSIICIASAGGIRAFSRSSYNVSKAGVIMLVQALARDLGRYDIRANAIAPTIIKTEMTRRLQEDPKALTAEAARIPLRRVGEVEDVAGVAVFLAADASSYVSGHTIPVDGGQLA